ncbi:uncharacterized protein LOC127288124 [Leptopilina boulardi]|uniref:uncharacterized protein LOC127288124 n=1 Tax=Leptopilina boulardi TaxID=63433 RepID=UPI0021F51E8F|nr:uncharacterized protein LOC127288124 [Leptopilina boulardi]
MSCSVKISSARSWSGSQRKINSVAEETTTTTTHPVSPGSGNIGTTLAGGQKVISPRPVKSIAVKKGEDTSKLLKYIDDNVIGKNGIFFGPFGRRKVVYCDYTASGRSLQFLEEYITKEVLPLLGDTRTSTSICSLQSSLFRHEARDIVRHAVGAGEQDAVLFTGQGTAGALRTLLRHLDLTTPTVVFVGPFEHHGNLRPWREYGVKIIRIKETREGFLDLNDLERKLESEKKDNSTARMIGYFSAASCITGVLADDVATTLLLRQHKALSIWDYTSAAPNVRMEMNPHLPGVGETAVHKDAIIFAGHKFIGGVQSPGVLIVKRSLLREEFEHEDMRDSHRYLHDPELREESGTAGVVGAIRCGLAMQLKENVTPQAIAARQDKISRQVLAHVRTIPELILLGSTSQNVKRLPIFSFMVRHPRGTFLHHNFVCAVLNDVFGVQARGGCACAGRYAHDLMGIDEKLAKEYEAVLESGGDDVKEESNAEALRPGFARLSFPYFMSEAEVAFVLEALKMVATEGWKLLPQYVLNPDTGEWRHHTNSVFKERKWLGAIRYTDGKMNATERRVSGSGVFPQSHSDCLQTARNIFNKARKMAQRYPLQIDHSVIFNEKAESLRWFILPNEAQDLLLGNSQNVKQHVPFDPTFYKLAGHAFFDTTPISSAPSYVSNVFAMRRLNSDVPRSGNPPVSPISLRHRSLPALPSDGKNGKYKLRINDVDDDDVLLSSKSGQKSPATCPGSPMPSVRFAVGEVVSSGAVGMLGTTPTVARLIASEQNLGSDTTYVARTRCNSLGSSSGCRSTSGGKTSPVPIPLSPQTLASLGIANNTISQSRFRHCSCSSQTDLNNGSFDSDAAGSPNRSSSSLGHVPIYSCSSSIDSNVINASSRHGRSSPVPSNVSQSSEDDLRAYLKEVTKELATEIKSEIREVISKVDDVLSETNTCETTPQHQSKQQHQQHDSFSASDIAEYLMEFSKEMASEVKSEIRCMVNSVDGLHRYSPDDRSSSECASPAERRRIVLPTSTRPRTPVILGKLGELSQQDSKMSSECSSDETVIYVVKSNTGDGEKNTDEDDIDDDDVDHEEHNEPEKALPKIYSAVNSVSSQDSGINLSFHENDKSGESPEIGRSSSAESNSNGYSRRPPPRLTINTGINFTKQVRLTNDDLSEDEEAFLLSESSGQEGEDDSKTENGINTVQSLWHCSPKNVWKPVVAAMQEFEMIKDNDRVLVCLSLGGRNSLALVHTLHQYQFYVRSKGIDFEIGVAAVDDTRYDPLESMSYLKALDVPYFYEEIINSNTSQENNDDDDSISNGPCNFCDRSTRGKLYSVAKKHNYNVLALGQNLDDLTEGFLATVFHSGKLRTMKAHYNIREQELRVIRPFVYVSDKALRQFFESKKLPLFREAGNEDALQKRQRNEELITRHEQSYPRLYWSLRSALRPLIAARVQSSDNQQQINQEKKRQQFRRTRTNSFNSSPIVNTSRRSEDSEETDEEPIV